MSARTTGHDILPIFTERWSPRSFTDETIATDDLNRMFEAARWAPSAFNSQPWRFVYARRGTADWAKFVDLLMPYNQGWAMHAAALVYVLSAPTFIPDGKTEPQATTHASFGCGTAWGFLALQAHSMGWIAHAMAGIHADRIPVELGAPDGFKAEVAIAIGRQGPLEHLPEKLQAKEVRSLRLPLDEIAMEGGFSKASL
jgi:nitroreductase